MPSRPSLTILLLTRQLLVRADFRGAALVERSRQSRPEYDDLGLIIEEALLVGPPAGRTVWLLDADLWTQVISLPRVKTRGMTPEQLRAALAFEAEHESGLPAFDAVLGVVARGGDGPETSYWLTAGRAADLTAITDAVRRLGARFGGIAHPAGVPRRLDGRGAAAWDRIEWWPDVVVCRRATGAEWDVAVSNADPRLGRWQADTRDWHARAAPGTVRHLLVAPGLDAPPSLPVGPDGEPVQFVDLQAESAAEAEWLTAWAGVLGRRPDGVPILVPAAEPVSTGRVLAISALVTLVCLAACVWHYRSSLAPQIPALVNERDRLQGPVREIGQIQARIADADKQRTDVAAEADVLKHEADFLARQQRRLGEFLRCLARFRSSDLTIRSIENDGGEPKLVGVCLRPELADRFARELTDALSDLGWTVQPSHKAALGLQADGGPWTFELRCSGHPLPARPDKAKPLPGGRR